MTAKQVLDAVYKALGVTQADVAQQYGWTPQQLSDRLVRGSLRADDFLALLEMNGVDITFTKRESNDNIKVHIIHGAGRHVRRMVNKVIYDTANSDALANNFYADGVNEYNDGKALELYIDAEGRYFFAEYSNFEGVKDRIMPVTADDAAAFIAKYGTQIHKGPTE